MAAWFESVGSVAAACTTLCWLPQAVKIIREKRTEGISLITQGVFTLGVALWAVYGALLHNRPIFYANVVTLGFALAILILKIRFPYFLARARKTEYLLFLCRLKAPQGSRGLTICQPQ